jgi:hypothetical protein
LTWWDGAVTVGTLGFFLGALADCWLGSGVAAQVSAFKGGLGDMASLDNGNTRETTVTLPHILCAR